MQISADDDYHHEADAANGDDDYVDGRPQANDDNNDGKTMGHKVVGDKTSGCSS